MEGSAVGPTQKRPQQLSSAAAAGSSPKKPRMPVPPPPSDDESAAAEELTRLLDLGPEVAPFKVRFVPYPYTSHSIYESTAPSSSSYITINVGNEESCGSSFSDCDSSVMASVDIGGLNNAGLGGKLGGGGGEKVARGDWDELDEALAAFIGDDY